MRATMAELKGLLRRPSVRMVGVAVVGMPLVLAILCLLYSHLRTEMDLKENLLRVRHHTVERRASALSHFFADRMDDLVHLKHSREVAMCFENRAPGTSVEYGLKQNLVMIRKLFFDLMKRKQIGDDTIYARLAYIAADGRYLADTATASREPQKGMAAVLRNVLSSGGKRGRVSMSRDAEYFMVATTHEHRGEPRGHIVGWIRPGIVYRHILGADESAQSSYVICDGDGNPLLISNIAAAYPVHPNMIRSLPAGGYREFSLGNGTGSSEAKMVAYRIPVPDTTYSLVHLCPAEKIYGTLASADRVATVSLLVIALLAGTAFTVRSMMLKTSVDELERKVNERTADLRRLNEDLRQEVSEREVVIRSLEEAEKRYRSIFENAVEGMFQTMPDGRVISVNPALALMHGYGSPKEMVSELSGVAERLYADEGRRSEFVRLMEENGAAFHFETRTCRKDGTVNWVSMNARNVRNEKGETLYYEGSVEDITERKSLESQLLHSQKMEAIGTLAGSIAHDFNNILTAIVGYGNLLQLRMQRDDPLRTYADRILFSSQKAIDLTRSLLAFGKKQPVELRPQRVGVLIEGAGKLLKRLLTEDIDLRMDSIDGDAVVMADRTQIGQVLMNLATNARDAMPGGGTLAIEAKRMVMGNDFVRLHGYGSPGGYVLVRVADTGAGMDERTMKKVFEPFFTTKAEGKGTGLGLSIVYGIVKQHNGYINVESEPGKGTTFSLYFPEVQTGEAVEAEAAQVPLNIRTGSETILVAEDNAEARSFLTEVLSVSGYTVIETVDGNEALRTFSDNRDRIALVISDVVMPGRNGKELREEIRKIRPDMKILFTSGYTRDVLLFKGIHDKAADYISKPLSPNDLLGKVREMLDEHPDPVQAEEPTGS
ncbi:MAG: Blue-light-activated protein [Syntrophorhabdus sp. PtaB.Bin047]|nr:MAG: Blue-light-activated protein [Syntrophorhabdus sp. PtaB.Bin047]